LLTLPPLVALLTNFHEAWIVGSAADPGVKKPRDYDVVVPFRNWRAAAGLIPKDAWVNSFGGWKSVSAGVEVDVWPGDLDVLLQHPKTSYIWQPHTGTRLVKFT
jgi:hypothetical protein